jgi:glycerate 2-kinase
MSVAATSLAPMPPCDLLRAMFDAAIKVALPAHTISPYLPPKPKGRTIVVGAGKASAAMAKAVEDLWSGPLEGLAVTRYGHAVPCRRVEIIEAAHPVPDAKGKQAAQRILDLVSGLTKDDVVLALISGGGSALLALPAPGLTLEDKQAVNNALLRSCVRKHLSAIKGGRLAAAAYPARVVTLLISDVPGDDPSVIASGPTVPDPTTFSDALAILRKYHIDEPRAAVSHLAAAADETPKPHDSRLAGIKTAMIATPQHSLEAAAEIASSAGFTPFILGSAIEGEAREVGKVMAGIARQVVGYGQPAASPCALLSGGETTVTIRGSGRGGRNVEFLLSLAISLDGLPGVFAIAGDTDGIDGAEEIAGALVTPDTVTRARARGIDPKASLANNDGHGFFEALGDQIVTGPTLTNVNDFRAVLITNAAAKTSPGIR